MKLIDAMINKSKESRREGLLHTFEKAGQNAAVIQGLNSGSMKTIRYY